MRAIDWLRRSDHYDWLTLYLEPRGLTRPIRQVMGVVALSLVLIPIEATVVPVDRRGWAVMTVYWILGGAGVVAGCLWLTRWPTRRQSLALALAGNATMAIWAVLQSDPLLSLLAGASLVISGGYFALFHPPRYVLYHVVVVTIVGAQAAGRLWSLGDPVHAALSFWLVFALNVVAPLGVLMLINAFGVDLPHADRDPLTGLLNRRALDAQVAASIAVADPTGYFRATVIDLDDFKRLNDTYGHSAGDEAIARVAQILVDCSDHAAVICRTGGEEFLIADATAAATSPRYVELIREQIALLPTPVTASLGTVRARMRDIDAHRARWLMDLADRAMYEAKRHGGNQVRHTSPTVADADWKQGTTGGLDHQDPAPFRLE